MQVSHQDEYITHAVVGQQESIEMGVSDSSALMHILSASLYTYTTLACIREVMCNAWDAHIQSGKTDQPIEVSVSSNRFVVRDFGTGIPHDRIGEIYGTYGNSTKREDSASTGGFGLGSKAPFAYTDNFEVTSCYDGVKTIYRVSKSSMEKGGKPTINKIVSVPTEETGITVTVPIEAKDVDTFISEAREIATLGNIKTSGLFHNNAEHWLIPTEDAPNGYVFCWFDGTNMERINVRYGNVVYPIPVHPEYEELHTRINNIIRQLGRDCSVIFMAPPDTVAIQPSRESLILSDTTVTTVKSLLQKFNFEVSKSSYEQFRQGLEEKLRVQVKAEMAGYTEAELLTVLEQNSRRYAEITDTADSLYSFDIRGARRRFMVNNDKAVWVSEQDVCIYALRQLVRCTDGKKRKMYKHLLKVWTFAHTRYTRDNAKELKAVAMRHIFYPLVKAARESETIKMSRLQIVDYYSYGAVDTSTIRTLDVSSLIKFIKLNRKMVVLYTSKELLTQTFRHMSNRDSYGFFAYRVGQSVKEQLAVLEFFEKLGYKVIEAIAVPAPRKKKEADNSNEPPKPRKPRRKGYMTLASCYSSVENRWYTSQGRSNSDGVEKPIAYVKLRTSDMAWRFSNFTSEECCAIHKLFGDKIAVPASTLQKDRLEAEGVPELSDYLYDYVYTRLGEHPQYPRFLAMGKFFKESKRYSEEDSLIFHMQVHKPLMEKLGMGRLAIDPELQMLVTVAESDSLAHVKRRQRNQVPSDLPHHHLEKKVVLNKKVGKLCKEVKNSPLRKFLNMENLSKFLANRSEKHQLAGVVYDLVEKLATTQLNEAEVTNE